MKRTFAVLLVGFAALTGIARCDEPAPLKLTQTYKLPADVKGNFDHLAIDLAGNRLFAGPEPYKAVLLFLAVPRHAGSSAQIMEFDVRK